MAFSGGKTKGAKGRRQERTKNQTEERKQPNNKEARRDLTEVSNLSTTQAEAEAEAEALK